jgi:hypothetical protein
MAPAVGIDHAKAKPLQFNPDIGGPIAPTQPVRLPTTTQLVNMHSPIE